MSFIAEHNCNHHLVFKKTKDMRSKAWAFSNILHFETTNELTILWFLDHYNVSTVIRPQNSTKT